MNETDTYQSPNYRKNDSNLISMILFTSLVSNEDALFSFKRRLCEIENDNILHTLVKIYMTVTKSLFVKYIRSLSVNK